MPPGTFKCLVRTIFLAKRREAQNLMGAVSKLRNALDTSTQLITVAVAGNLDIVRVTLGVSSFEELETVSNEVATDKIRPYVENISGLAVRAIRCLRTVETPSRG